MIEYTIKMQEYWFNNRIVKMKKLYGGVLIASSFTLFMLMILRYGVMKNPIGEGYLNIPVLINGTNPLEWINPVIPPAFQNPA
jgi:beta-1,3-galactosyltransferase